MAEESKRPRAKKNTVRVLRRKLTEAEQGRLNQSRAEVEAQRDEFLAKGRRLRAASLKDSAALGGVMKMLREERNRQGLSLADLTERTGIVRSAISELETADQPNPTINTITRIAEALGMDVAVRLVRRGK